MANIFALLIGIDFYLPNPYYQNLQGAVRDIDRVADYLENSLKIPSANITRLTSFLPNTNSLADIRAARGEIKPTYENIIKSFQNLTETAQDQDLIYIHYSGHGGRVKTIFPELKGEEQFDEGLVPMDVGNNNYYLRDVEIATLLKNMTEKGLIVTVVFDSCHSGGATRGDGDIRGAREGLPDTNERPSDSLVASREELTQNWLNLTQNPQNSWLPQPNNYVFLGACRPSEFAYEAAFEEGKERHGALTYWLLDTLNMGLNGFTYQTLYDRLKGQIQSKFPKQLPVLIGEKDRLVFGREIKAQPYTLTVISVTHKQVTLDGGLAQALSKGTRFAIYPLGSDYEDHRERLAVVEVETLQASTATAKILPVEIGGVTPTLEKIEPGLPAILESAPLELKHRVRLFSKEVGEKEYELPQVLAEKQNTALQKIHEAIQNSGWVTEVTWDTQEAHYQVAVNRRGEYEISRLTPINNLTPALSIEDPEAPRQVIKRLEHLTKYEAIYSLDNPKSKLSIEFELLDQNQQTFPDPNNIQLSSGTVYLRIKNTHNQSLNIAILNLEATWAVSLLPIENQDTAFYEIAPGQNIVIDLDFIMPEGKDYQDQKEILKLMATKGIANFRYLTLPSLDEELETRGNQLNQELQDLQQAKGVNRTATEVVNPLNQLLAQIGADIDNPPQLTRAFRVKPSPDADWITKSITVGFNVE